ncbi:MAG TPA: YidB family protein [Gemmatimonadaceae bacterium]|jgi:uncharacterized protein YidB (DUF937 family)
MGLLDGMMDKAKAAFGQADDASNPLMGQVMDLINQHGGVAGIAQTFRDRGFGSAISSWISTGQNLPITGDQLQSVLGSAKVQELAEKAGVSPDMLQTGLATLLPNVIDKLTPDGKLPTS